MTHVIISTDPSEGYCEKSRDGMHCVHWWDLCEPCHYCGFDGGGEDCDCPRHTAERQAQMVP